MAEEKGISVTIPNEEIKGVIKEYIVQAVKVALLTNKKGIEDSIRDYFHTGDWGRKTTQFDRALDWAIEQAFREGIELAMTEMNLPELIAQKAKELISSGTFLQDLAEAKVRASLGLSPIDNQDGN